MRALSLSQPWCWAVVDPIARKHVENRSWAPPIGMIEQRIAIHAAKSWDDEMKYRHHPGGGMTLTPTGYLLALGISHMPALKERYAQSAIVGVVTIDRVVTKPDTIADDQKRWFFGEYGWLLKDVVPLASSVPCNGKQGLWTVPPDVELAVLAQLGGA